MAEIHVEKCIVNRRTQPENICMQSDIPFDLPALQAKFGAICPDYNEDLVLESKSMALAFCSLVIWTIGPESQKAKKRQVNMYWKLSSVNSDKKKNQIIISNYRNQVTATDNSNDNYLALTVKEATLICHKTLKKICDLSFMRDVPKVLMTPLSHAVFCNVDIAKMAADLNVDTMWLISAVNQSTINGGEYLPDSDINIAICASECAVKCLKDENLKNHIVSQTKKKYIDIKKKLPDKRSLDIIKKYAIGGIPAEFSYENLSRIFDRAQEARREAREAKILAEQHL